MSKYDKVCPVCGANMVMNECTECVYKGPGQSHQTAEVPPSKSNDLLSAESLAERFHNAYERLAPYHGYETREETAKEWAEVPENNRQLMIHVCAELLREGI